MSSTAMAKIWNADLAHAAEVRVSGHPKTGGGRETAEILVESWGYHGDFVAEQTDLTITVIIETLTPINYGNFTPTSMDIQIF